MASNPNDYRDPKVTKDGSSDSSIGKWIAIAIAALLLLLLLGWLIGLFDNDQTAVVPANEPDAVIVAPETEPDAVIVTE